MAFQREYQKDGVKVVWINSNNASLSPADTYEEMVRRVASSRLPFPYLKDEHRVVAR